MPHPWAFAREWPVPGYSFPRYHSEKFFRPRPGQSCYVHVRQRRPNPLRLQRRGSHGTSPKTPYLFLCSRIIPASLAGWCGLTAAWSWLPWARNSCAFPHPLEAGVPVTGDWVWIGPNRAGDRQILGTFLPRRSELSRKRAFEDSSAAQVLAANMDVIGVVVPVDRPLTHNRLERTLVAAWDSGAVPLGDHHQSGPGETWRTTSSGRSSCRQQGLTWSPPQRRTGRD